MPSMSERLQSVIVGVGVAGERHARSQSALGFKTFLHDVDPARAIAVADRIDGATAINNNGLLSASRDSALVTVATPDHLHVGPALRALASGTRALLIEKPVATSLADAENIRRTADDNDVTVFVGNNYRLTPAFGQVKERVARGDIGEILRVDTSYIHDMRKFHEDTPWRKKQDFLWGGGVHAVDLAVWVGGPIDSVSAIEGESKLISGYTMPERYAISLGFESGAVGGVALDSRAVQPAHGTDLVVFGTEGKIIAHNKNPELTIFDAKTGLETIEDAGNAMTVDLMNKIVFEWLVGENENHDPVPTLNDAMHVVRVVDAIEQDSARVPRRVIQKN